MPQFIKSGRVDAICDLLLSQVGVERHCEQINLQPKSWINFRNGFYDPVEKKMHEHDPKYYAINQIPYDFDLKWLEAAPVGKITEKFLRDSLSEPDIELFFQYLGYSMTVDTRLQRFLMIKGKGGTGKSVLVYIVTTVVGAENTSSVSIQDLTQRFYPTALYGKLVNACADISSKALEDVHTIKKATGEDSLLFERKSENAQHFNSYAKLLFSANELPLNLDEKTNAYYRRLMVLTMNNTPSYIDLDLKEKISNEIPYIITRAVKALAVLYSDKCFSESESSKKAVEDLYRSADSVKAFIDARIQKSYGAKIYRPRMYEAYVEYCQAEERNYHKKKNFFKYMGDKGYVLKRDKDGVYFDGVVLVEEDDWDIPFE